MAPKLLEQSLDDVIRQEAIYTVLQPIVDLNQQCAFGYEALTRTKSDNLLQNPDLLFDTAQSFNRLTELETLCLKTAVSYFSNRESDALLFINVCPESLIYYSEHLSDALTFLRHFNMSPANLVLEISERFPIENASELKHTLSLLKHAGFSIAIDDLGSGYSGLKLWSELNPDFIKIDRHFIDQIDQDPVKQAFVNSVVQLCEQLNCEVIAEGIETDAELATLRSMGINLAQGYLLGKPQREPEFSLPNSDNNQHSLISRNALDRPIGDLCHPLTCVAPETSMHEADLIFAEVPELASVPVLEDGMPLGLIHRNTILENFARPYGRALFEKRPVRSFIESDALIVDYHDSISKVSKKVTDCTTLNMMQPVIITRDGRYEGVVETRTLLRHITDAQIQTARYANPLTMLPGNVLIDEHIDQLSHMGKEFQLLYLDLNYFKPYNDLYGYRQGDAVLRSLGNILLKEASGQHFVGHIGGDDFVIVAQERDVSSLCQRILGSFLSRTDDYHHPDDVRRGYLCVSDREGKNNQVPLLGLSIGVVPSALICDGDTQTLAVLAAKAKKLAKAQPGSSWYCLHEETASTCLSERQRPDLSLVGSA
ncbi:MAG: bifunctional diguanylate cyclase/phosphodiesterase [Thalassolituus sp.]